MFECLNLFLCTAVHSTLLSLSSRPRPPPFFATSLSMSEPSPNTDNSEPETLSKNALKKQLKNQKKEEERRRKEEEKAAAKQEDTPLGWRGARPSSKRLYNQNRPDLTLERAYSNDLRSVCPPSGGDNNISPSDYASPVRFDNTYYKLILGGRGLLTSDEVLLTGNTLAFDDACSTPEEAAKSCPAFDKANDLSLKKFVDVLWPIKKRLNIGSEATLKKCVEITDHVVYKLIERRAQEMRQSQDSTSVTRYDILSRFLYSGETDPKNLRDSTLSFVIPRRNATSATLAWFFYMLCKQPELQEKLAQEIKNVTKVESVANITEFAENLSDEHLAKMHYLHAVLTETLRLYPAVPMDVKMCFSDDTLPDGYKVNKGDLVFYLPYAMGRMKSIWGDDAKVFRSERWLSKDSILQAGPRMCLGKECAVVISSFTFKLADERKPITYGVSINLFIKGGLHVCAQPR
ncbi:hypothetical protein Droror1_Dr00011617 [Drosera rotundifolia]